MKLFNTKTRQLEDFLPLNDRKVLMYVCGITPYDTTHLGHAFTYVFYDALRRYLTYKKYDVRYVQNVTDIDDDILKKAKETGKNWAELGEFWTNKFLKEMKSLNVLPPTNYVKATDSITQIIEITKNLVGKKIAYEKNGTVFFNVKKFKEYGELSHLTEHQMNLISRERGGNPDDPNKINTLDFILWQKDKEGEPCWNCLWGKGRPGWHIECSSMIKQYLGDQIDIHGGGRDLVYPHHESEIAQSESFTGKKPFVKYWVHTAMVMCNGEKMSKSLSNLIMISDLLKKYSANAIRATLLSHHYRKPWEFDENEIAEHEEKLKKININKQNSDLDEFEKIMDNDMDTPKALYYLIENSNIEGLKILGFNF